MHADAFDPGAMLSDAAPGDDSLGGLLGALLDRTGAVPLPDPDSALGIEPKVFASLEDYEDRVLSRLTPGAPAMRVVSGVTNSARRRPTSARMSGRVSNRYLSI